MLASYGFVPPEPRNPSSFVRLRGALGGADFDAFSRAADPRLVDEARRWQSLDFRIYDRGERGDVDPTLLAVGRALTGSDAALARSLGARAREELARVDAAGELRREVSRAACSGDADGVVEAVLRCRCAERDLWERVAEAMEEFAAGTQAVDLPTFMRG